MKTLRVLGAIELHDAEGNELRAVVAQQKRLALLAYLAHSTEQPFHTRERLLALLWPEFDESRGRSALSQALYYLRQELGSEALPGRGGEEIGVNPAFLSCDAAEFRLALAAGDEARALDLYRGDFLEGQHLVDGSDWDAWVEAERTELRSLAARAGWAVAEREEAAGNTAEAASQGRRALALSGPDESALRKLLELLDRLGDRAAAIHTYEGFADRLARDYELEVSPETSALVARIRSREGGATDATSRVTDQASKPARASASDASPVVLRPPVSRPAPSRRRWRLAIPVVALAALAGLLVLRNDPADDAAPLTSIDGPAVRLAVLPFDNFGEDPSDLYIADGMTEELISRLSTVGGLQVIARTSVMPYRASGKSVAEIGRELNVPYVLEGSVRSDGSTVRFAVQLIDARTQEHVWAENFDDELVGILRLQSEIAERVARALPVEPLEEERRRLARRDTSDPEAHLLYLRGRHMLARGDLDSFDLARGFFESALERDPAYARAWSGLADALDRLAWAHAVSPDAAHGRARAAAERALEMDPELAEGHASLARTLSAYYWEFEDAEHHFLRAIELDPSNAEARRAYAALLMLNDRQEEARVQSLSAVELDPLSYFSHFQLVLETFLARRYDEALERAEALVEMRPEGASAYFMLAKVRAERGEYEEALRALDRADPEGDDPPALATRAYVHVRLGDPARARAILADLTRSDGPPTDFESGVVLLALGERERALARLHAAIDRRDRRVRLLLREPIFEPYQEDPGFKALIERAGLGPGARGRPGDRTALRR